MTEDLCDALKDSIIIFHACARNLDGIDPTDDIWGKVHRHLRGARFVSALRLHLSGLCFGQCRQRPQEFPPHCHARLRDALLPDVRPQNLGLHNQRVSSLAIEFNDASRVEQSSRNWLWWCESITATRRPTAPELQHTST